MPQKIRLSTQLQEYANGNLSLTGNVTTTNANVGINTTTPNTALDIYSNPNGSGFCVISLRSANNSSSPALYFYQGNTVKAYIAVSQTAGGFVTGSQPGDLTLRSAISGNVLISADDGNTPHFKLANNGVLMLNNGVKTVGYQYLWGAPASTTYYKFASLPASNAGTFDSLTIEGVLNQGWGGDGTSSYKIRMGNRNAFAYRWTMPHLAQYLTNTKFLAYQEGDGTTSVYVAVVAGTFCYATFDVTAVSQATIIQNPVANTTSPSGTLVFDSSNTSYAMAPHAWVAPSLGSNITNYDTVNWDIAGYLLDSDGFVHLRGLITGSGITEGAVLFTLPAGYRPKLNHLFLTLGYIGSGTTSTAYRVDVQSNGQVIPRKVIATDGNPTGWFSLSGITFPTFT